MSSVMADAAAVGNVGEAAALPGGPSRRRSRRAPAASDDDSDDSSSSTTPRRERAKRELVDSLLNLEKRQRRDDTARLDPVAIADLGRQVLRGQYLRAWQTVIEDRPRWVWEEDAETPEDENILVLHDRFQRRGIGSDLDNLDDFRQIVAETQSEALQEARCDHSLPAAQSSHVDFQQLDCASPGIDTVVTVLLGAPGYRLENLRVEVTLPATVDQLIDIVRASRPGLIDDCWDHVIPTIPQLSQGIASFVVAPVWFAEAAKITALLDARALGSTVFPVVLSLPTNHDEIHRVAGFHSIAARHVFVEGSVEPLWPGQLINLYDGAVIRLTRRDRRPLWAPPLSAALLHAADWQQAPTPPRTRVAKCVLLLHASGKFLLSHFTSDSWDNLNRAARLVGVPLADVKMQAADPDGLQDYVYRGTPIKGLVAVFPRVPDQGDQAAPREVVIFVDMRPLGRDVNFLLLPTRVVSREALRRYIDVDPPEGWRLAVRGGRKCREGFEVFNGEVLTLAFIRQSPHQFEQVESESDFSEDDEDLGRDESSDSEGSTRIRSPSKRTRTAESSDQSYQSRFDAQDPL